MREPLSPEERQTLLKAAAILHDLAYSPDLDPALMRELERLEHWLRQLVRHLET